MTKSDKVLVLLLRIVGVGALFALVAVFMPVSWMAATHRWLGLGEMPTGPVVEYLARSLSAFYAVMGALCLVLAADLERYRPLVRFLGVAFALMSVVLLGVDLGVPELAEQRGGLVVFDARSSTFAFVDQYPQRSVKARPDVVLRLVEGKQGIPKDVLNCLAFLTGEA